MTRLLVFFLPLVLVLEKPALSQDAKPAPSLTTRAGKTHPLQLSARGKIEGASPAEIFSVTFRPRAPRDPAAWRIVTDTDRFLTATLETDESKLKIATELLGEVAFPLAAVRAIQRADFGALPRARQELARTVAAQPTRDVLLIEKDGSFLPLVGLLKGVRENRFTFHWQDADREVEAGKVIALALATASSPPPRDKEAVAVVGDVDVVTGKLGAITDDIALDSPLLGSLKISRKKIAALDFVAGRRVWVSDLMPAGVKEAGYFGETFGWQRDTSVQGRPLRLRRLGAVEEFAKGLGTHARCELRYKLEEKFQTLAAVIGIDAAANARGAAEFIVLADGKEIYRSGVIKAGEDAKHIFVSIASAQTITLRSDFAPQTLGIAAHADWADAQLIE